MPLPDNVAIYIAGKIKSNIRELEGSLIRLIAYASLTGREISLPLAQDVLQERPRSTTSARSRSRSSRSSWPITTTLKLIDLKSRNNSKSVAMPRQIAMYLCKSLTNASLPEIGRSFGGKHHSTVIHSIRKIEDLRQKDGGFQHPYQQPSRSRFARGIAPVFHSCRDRSACGRSVRARRGRNPQQAGRKTLCNTDRIVHRLNCSDLQGLTARIQLFNSTSLLL